MTLRRCFVEPEWWTEAEIALAPEESRHAAAALRLRAGAVVLLWDGQGHEMEAEVLAATPAAVRVRPRPATRRTQPRPPVALTLIQALPKHGLLEWIVEKAVELGAHAVQPVFTERVIARWRPADSAKHRARWQRVAREAAKQCGLAWLPEIAPLRPLADVLADPAFVRPCLVGSLQARADPLPAALADLRAARPAAVSFVIGPEGDLTASETQRLVEAGARLVSFGPRTLRVETAALYGLSVCVYELMRPAAPSA